MLVSEIGLVALLVKMLIFLAVMVLVVVAMVDDTVLVAMKMVMKNEGLPVGKVVMEYLWK